MTTLDDLKYFWMDNGAPCFISDRENICDIVENLGFQIYYVITNKGVEETYSKTQNGVTTKYTAIDKNAAVLKIVNNFMGRVVMDSPDPFPESYSYIVEACEYNMPEIPRTIVKKLDEFFRLVHSQHGTESIVLLTFDPTKTDSSGWGVLVPEQSNTSVHCKYDAESIADIKPEHVMIVGSVHSHPEMSAYASGTDHEDQADFDGLHITYGWQKSVDGGKTKYHIEFQIGGSAYILKEDAVFEPDNLVVLPDPEVLEWSNKVKKALPPQGGSASGTAWLATGPTQTAPLNKTPNQTTSLQNTSAGIVSNSYPEFVAKLSTVEDNALVAIEIDLIGASTDCTVCLFPITEKNIKDQYCPSCDAPIVDASATQGEIIFALTEYAISRDLDAFVPYYIYCKDTNNDYLLRIKEPQENPYELISDYELSSINTQKYGTEPSTLDRRYNAPTLCCGVAEDLAQYNCHCPRTVYEDYIHDFDTAHRDFDVYDKNSTCLSCVSYYQPVCPFYSQAVVNFITHGEKLTQQIQTCDNYEDWYTRTQSYELDHALTESYYYDRD